MKKKVLIPLIALVGLAVIGYFVYPSIRTALGGNQAQSSYQTEAAKRGGLSVAVGGTGTVRANQSAVIGWQTSGKVMKVAVKKGQQVTADTVLAQLDENSLPQTVMQAKADLTDAQNALDQAINNSKARSDAHLALVQAQQELDDAEDEAQSKLYRRASQETIDIARANLINANEALDNAESVWDQTKGAGENSPVYAAGLSQWAAARQEQQRAEYNLRYVEELPDPLKVEESNIKVDQARAKLLEAKREWEKVKDGPDADQVQAAETKIQIAQAKLDQAKLKAPFAGTITRIDSQVGDLVNTGTQAINIEDRSHLLVDVDISEVDIQQVQVGQPVSMTFDALAGQEFAGAVTDIASSGTTTSGTVNFTVTVEIQQPSAEIKPGMTAAINVTVSQIEDVLLVPSRAVRTVNGQRVVYVLRGSQPAAVDITLGASANNYSQITAGDLQAGDLIVLNPPADGLPMGPGSGAGSAMGGAR